MSGCGAARERGATSSTSPGPIQTSPLRLRPSASDEGERAPLTLSFSKGYFGTMLSVCNMFRQTERSTDSDGVGVVQEAMASTPERQRTRFQMISPEGL